jgi:hypothetical protein
MGWRRSGQERTWRQAFCNAFAITSFYFGGCCDRITVTNRTVAVGSALGLAHGSRAKAPVSPGLRGFAVARGLGPIAWYGWGMGHQRRLFLGLLPLRGHAAHWAYPGSAVGPLNLATIDCRRAGCAAGTSGQAPLGALFPTPKPRSAGHRCLGASTWAAVAVGLSARHWYPRPCAASAFSGAGGSGQARFRPGWRRRGASQRGSGTYRHLLAA